MISLFIFTIISLATAAEVQYVNLTNTTSFTWSSGSPYPAENQTVIVECEQGYIIHVTVNECDLSGEDGDFMLIKAGKSLQDSGSGRVFTYNIKSPREYLVDSNTVFLNFQVFGANEKSKSGAVITFERFGDQHLITTESPVSTTVWPEHSVNDSIYYDNAITTTVKVNNETISELRLIISQMAVVYSEEEMIPLAENITIDNVLLQDVKVCPYYWPETDKCFWINFSLPIILAENQTDWTGYQLTRNNLSEMWKRHAEQYLGVIGLKPYVKPDDDFMLLIWTLIIGGVTLIFVALLFIMRYLMISLTRKDKKELSDTDSIISKHRDSNLSLDPHPLQSIPELFENDFPMYEPGLSPTQGGYENHGMSDEDSDEDEVLNTHKLNLTANSSTRLQESES